MSANFQKFSEYNNIIELYNQPDYLASMLLWATLFLSLPAFYEIFRNIRWDRSIGEYSYPIYLVHYPLVEVLFHSKK